MYIQQIPGMARLMELTPELIAHYSDAPQEAPMPAPVMTAMVVSQPHGLPPKLHPVPLTSVDMAREEFGPSAADAKAFVLDTCCTECGYAACEVKTCHGCGIQGCACLVTEADHGDIDVCGDCAQPCYGRCCNDAYDD